MPAMTTMTSSLLPPGTAIGRSTIRTTGDRTDVVSPAERDAMLAAVPGLRAFAISLSRNADRADDLVQETLVRAIAGIGSYQPGSHMSAWLFTILRNLFRSEYRKRRREVEDPDCGYVNGLKSPPEQHTRLEFEEFRVALAKLPVGQREALLLVGASGFSYEEVAAICKIADGQEPGQSCTHSARGAAFHRRRPRVRAGPRDACCLDRGGAQLIRQRTPVRKCELNAAKPGV